ncbi:MAG: hypothetical protein LCH78_18215 [Proteobacteria bacterium]|nr:hypothetical protein [Pseudomonadota bacterium]
MSEEDLLRVVPGMIGMRCPVCDKARISRRMAIDPPRARLAFYPCSEDCASRAHPDQVIYTDANRQPVPV